MKINWPDGLDNTKFLADYWQKKPLLIRGAFTAPGEIVSPGDLAGLACEQDIESRIIIENTADNSWQLQHGPFDEDYFQTLPDNHWTLLVQDVDKFIPDAGKLLENFSFLPDWRVDDFMVSYAADQGSVGPHTDSYDVFLLQLEGRRRWQISDKSYAEHDLLPDSEVKVLKNFSVSEQWLLEPGDMLYLPPDVAHWGVAQGECLTGSIGFVSPRENEIFQSWADSVAEYLGNDCRYQDHGLKVQHHHAEIMPDALEQFAGILKSCIDTSPQALAAWFGQMITEPKHNLYVEESEQAYTDEAVKQITGLRWHPFIKPLFFKGPDEIMLFVSGESFRFSPADAGFIEMLCNSREITLGRLPGNAHRDLIRSLLNKGYLESQ